VLSSVAAEATGLRDGEEVLLADSPADWLRQVGRLLEDDALWQTVSDTALRHARQHYNRGRGLARMTAALRQLDLPVQEATR
jgi:hypothetical protein